MCEHNYTCNSWSVACWNSSSFNAHIFRYRNCFLCLTQTFQAEEICQFRTEMSCVYLMCLFDERGKGTSQRQGGFPAGGLICPNHGENLYSKCTCPVTLRSIVILSCASILDTLWSYSPYPELWNQFCF